MPARLSKFFISGGCKDYVHPWSDSCIGSTAGLGLHAVQECLRIYSMLYIIGLMTKGRIPNLDDLKRTLLSILQSTAFLSWSAFSYSMFICMIRKVLPFNILTVSFIPSFLSSFTAILLERASRRPMLCLYVSNIATETLFRMAVSRGYLSVVPRGEIYIFAAGMATLLYFYRSKKENRDSIYKLIRVGVGPYEEKGYDKQQKASNLSSSNKNQNTKSSKSVLNLIWKALEVYKTIISRIKKLGGRHPTCPHPSSCIHYTIGGGVKMFGVGYCIQTAIKLIFQMKNVVRKPKELKNIFFKKDNLNLALFLGGFAGIYKLISCSLRRSFNKDSPEYAIIAGILASTSFAMYPSNTIALYVLWKALQLTWNHGVENGKVPEVKWFVIFLYCFSTAVLFHAAIVEPQNLRISYWKFLYNLSGGRVAMMSRTPIDGFGIETSKHLHAVMAKSRTHNNHVYSF